jgi:hypothetical protein
VCQWDSDTVIRVQPGAAGTDAYQKVRNLVLSDEADGERDVSAERVADAHALDDDVALDERVTVAERDSATVRLVVPHALRTTLSVGTGLVPKVLVARGVPLPVALAELDAEALAPALALGAPLRVPRAPLLDDDGDGDALAAALGEAVTDGDPRGALPVGEGNGVALGCGTEPLAPALCVRAALAAGEADAPGDGVAASVRERAGDADADGDGESDADAHEEALGLPDAVSVADVDGERADEGDARKVADAALVADAAVVRDAPGVKVAATDGVGTGLVPKVAVQAALAPSDGDADALPEFEPVSDCVSEGDSAPAPQARRAHARSLSDAASVTDEDVA